MITKIIFDAVITIDIISSVVKYFNIVRYCFYVVHTGLYLENKISALCTYILFAFNANVMLLPVIEAQKMSVRIQIIAV